MRKAYTVDQSRFPLVTLNYYDLLTDEEFEAQLEAVDKILLARKPHVLLVHTHHQRMMPMSQVRRQAAHMRERAELSKLYLRGIAMVIPSAVIRGVLKVILSIAPMPCPHAVFDELDEASAWAARRIAAT